ncbi:MAG: transposase domain-containing protein, partial [Actinobacteria bacterium]|nr:transposase domain-containing protein [Actinomycetota bacterium]
MRIQSATTTITHAVTVAAGVFAPGHLGELTQYLPFELVDDVLEQTRTVQRRLRDLPSRVGVYFLLALGMFPRLGYARVWAKLTAGLAGIPVPCPSEKALRELRRRLGPAPMKALFEVVAGPLAQPHTPGVRFGGLRTVAFDGLNSLKVPPDHARYPAGALVQLYHQRWEIESAYLALRHTLLDGHVLRSGDRPGIEQEICALLTLYQLLRMAMVTAGQTCPGTDPDRASVTTAIQAARDQLTAARGVCPDGPADLPGVIGRAVLDTLLPA